MSGDGCKLCGRDYTIRKTWIIVRMSGCVPEKKGGWSDCSQVEPFLRELMANRPPDTKYTVAQLTWNDDLWVTDGPEFLMDFVKPERKRAAHSPRSATYVAKEGK